MIFGKLVARPAAPYLKQCDQSADSDPSIPFPQTAGKPVSFFEKMLLKDTSPALVSPDYERALFINKILQLLWASLSPAIHKEVMKQADAPIKEAMAKVPLIEDLRIDTLDLGTRPFRIDSFKSYKSNEDEIIIEAPLFWGGDIRLRVTAVARLGKYFVDLPVDVSNIQLKALARITLNPLVEKLPCVGGVKFSLLEEPVVDFDLNVLGSPDLLALPIITLATRAALKLVAGKLIVFPNEMTFPILENFGLPPPPAGMLQVKVIRGKNLKSTLLDVIDPFVVVQVKADRFARTTTKQNDPNPEWNEQLDVVVDVPVESQYLKISVFDDDLMRADVVGGVEIDLSQAEFVKSPRSAVTLSLPLYAPGSEGDFPVARSEDLARANVPTPPSGSGSGSRTQKVVAPPKQKQKQKQGFMNRLIHKRKDAQAKEYQEGEKTALRSSAGEGQPPQRVAAGSVIGMLTVQITYYPFVALTEKQSQQQKEVKKGKEGGEGKTLKASPTLSISRTLQEDAFVSSTDLLSDLRGVLTVDLKKVMKLSEPTDSYVLIRLHDPGRLPAPDIEYKTKVELNEASPRFNYVADFVNISAKSVLTLTVYAQPGAVAALRSLKVPFFQKADAKRLGYVRLTLEDVIKDGRVRDVFPLHEAQTGEMHVGLTWTSVNVS